MVTSSVCSWLKLSNYKALNCMRSLHVIYPTLWLSTGFLCSDNSHITKLVHLLSLRCLVSLLYLCWADCKLAALCRTTPHLNPEPYKTLTVRAPKHVVIHTPIHLVSGDSHFCRFLLFIASYRHLLVRRSETPHIIYCPPVTGSCLFNFHPHLSLIKSFKQILLLSSLFLSSKQNINCLWKM